jgi:hypothetical protein
VEVGDDICTTGWETDDRAAWQPRDGSDVGGHDGRSVVSREAVG